MEKGNKMTERYRKRLKRFINESVEWWVENREKEKSYSSLITVRIFYSGGQIKGRENGG